MGRHDWTFALRIFGLMFIVYRPSSGATKRKFWEKDLKTITKHDSKLSEVILKVFWENAGKNSSVPHCQQGLMEEFPASKVHLQPANWRTRKFPCRRMSRQYWPVWVWSQGKIHPFSDIERANANQLNSGELTKNAKLTRADPESSERENIFNTQRDYSTSPRPCDIRYINLGNPNDSVPEN